MRSIPSASSEQHLVGPVALTTLNPLSRGWLSVADPNSVATLSPQHPGNIASLTFGQSRGGGPAVASEPLTAIVPAPEGKKMDSQVVREISL